MADTVRYLLEEMVPELEALEARGYFSRAEIRAIVQRRSDFEYALKRMAAVKRDYERYAQYEQQLDELREARRRSRAISGKRGLAEWCITRRVHFIYERATRKFRGDLELWSRWLRFCAASRSWRQMSRVLTSALRLHPGSAALWAYAAAWELEHNLNAGAARALMQRGLRMCGDAQPGLWHEYFRLELLYALRLRARRRVLGIDGGGGGGPGGEAGGGEVSGGEEGGEAGGEPAEAVEAVLRGAVAGVVLRSAIAAVPRSLPFRAKFLDLLAPLEFEGRQELEAIVYDSVERDFGGSAAAWDLRARRHVRALAPAAPAAARRAAAEAALVVYQVGLAAAPGADMVAALLGFLRQQLEAAEAEEEAAGGGAGGQPDGTQRRRAAEAARLAQWLTQWAARAFEEAAASGLLDEQLRLEGVAFMLRRGEVEPALAAARAGVRALPESAALWRQLLVVQAVLAGGQLAGDAGQQGQQARCGNAGAGSGSDEDEGEGPLAATAAADGPRSSGAPQRRLEQLALEALRSVPAKHAAPLWLTAVSVLAAGGCSLRGLAVLMVDAAMRQARGPVQGGLGAAAAALLVALDAAGGVQAARGLYRALLPLPPPGGDFFRALLRLEVAAGAGAGAEAEAGADAYAGAAGAGAPLPPARLRELFELAVDAYGDADAQLWLLYCEWHAARGAAAEAAAVYRRARRALREPEAFEAAHLLRFKLRPT